MTMDHIRNIGSRLTSYSISNHIPNNDDIVIKGFLAKRKNMKNRYFVLRKETSRGSARLEYYDSEKKFIEGFQPKKSYTLKDCFNIGRKPDKKNYVIALYTNKECIGLVAENERELQRWLHKIQEHRNSGVEHIDGPRIEYEHVWQVEVSQRSFAVNQNLTGQHWLCLTSRFLSLVRVDNTQSKKDFQLNSILSCGYLHQFFFFELDKFSGIGKGQLLMQAEDSFIAQNIHDCVKRAMENFGRISSTSESDVRRRTNSDPQSDVPCTKSRERCDSVPNNARRHPNSQGLCTSHETDQHASDSNKEKNGSDQNGLLIKLNKDSPGFDVSRYISLNSGERHPPNSLRLSPSLSCKSHSGMVSPNSGGPYNPPGMSTPVSPSIGIGPPSSGYLPMDLMPSPQGTTGSHSCNPSQTDDAYVLMLSPGTQAPQVTRVQSRTSSPYLEMDRTPVAPFERFRTTSTPTTTPQSLSDEDSCYEMYPNSGSSSCTSGTPSDHQIHDLAGDDRGSTPHCSSWTEQHNELDDIEIIIGPRPIRTNSVGSKPDQFKRKNRLETPVPIGEPARMRAFSLGSRMSIKYGVAHPGTSGFLQGNEHPWGIWDVFPSIKEYGNHAKSKSSSAPMLGAPAISHSWSGTPGAYFRGFSQSRNTGRETNLMELDFSTKKNCDLVSSEDKEKDRRSNKERLWHTFTGSRHRSNSKSSGGSTGRLVADSSCGSGKEKRSLESDSCSNCEIEIPRMGDNNLDDYLEVDFAPSPRNSASDSTKGYLVMHPPSFLSSSLTSASDFLCERRGQRTTSLNETDLDLSSSPSSCVSNDGYVEMTGGYGGSLTGLTIASSSSSSTSINALPSAANRTRRHNLVASTTTASQDLPSPIEVVDGGGFGTEGRMKAKKTSSKRRSLREGPKRKISDSGLGGDAPEMSLKSKASGSFASTLNNLTNLIISRKPSSSSNSTKAPLSSKGTPLPPKGSKESKSPCSSLNRLKIRDKDGCEAASHCEEFYKTSCPNSISPQGPLRRRTLELMDASPPPTDLHKGEEKMLFSPLDASRLRRQSSREAERRRSAYSACDSVSESSSGNKSSVQVLQMSPTQKPTPIVVASSPLGTRSYVNMQPGISSPLLSPFSRDTTVTRNVSQETSFPSTLLQAAPNNVAPLPSIAKSASEANYVMMSREDGKLKDDSASYVAKSTSEANYVMMSGEDGKLKEDSTSSAVKSTSEANYVRMSREGGKLKEDSTPSVAKSASEANYLMMSVVGKIREESALSPTLESVHRNQPQPPSLALENLSLESDRSSSSTSERSRSRSGPGTSEGSKSLKKTEDGRAASACSSPISYSPPTSPTLGSLSSMSSLSEGGLSSASSTCTVVNVGMRTPAGVIPKITSHQALPNPPSVTDPPIPVPPSEPRSSVKGVDCSFFCHVDPERGQCSQESK